MKKLLVLIIILAVAILMTQTVPDKKAHKRAMMEAVSEYIDDKAEENGFHSNVITNIGKSVVNFAAATAIDAKLKAYIDFSKFSEENVERDGDKITILLPDPQVTMTSSKIDQKNVRQYVGLTRSNFSDEELSNYQQQGRAAIIDGIPKMGIIESAQANATKVLVPMLVEMGYKEENIIIAFRKTYGPQDIQKLLKIED